MQIPLIDLKREYVYLQEEIEKKILEVLASGSYILGKNVDELEQKIAEYIGTKYAVSCANGTDALVLALRACGIEKGDEVITTPFSFFATSEAVSIVGAKPVFVDVDKEIFNIAVSKIEEKITKKTKAILPVHIFGNPCDMDEINSLAKKYDLKIVEDACQAIGAKYKNKMVGNLSDAACFSFFPTKNLGCFGDGGIITTNDENIYKIAKALRVHGSGDNGKEAYKIINKIEDSEKFTDGADAKYYNYLIGQNSRLDEIQASILNIKLNYLDNWNEKRRKNAKYYDEKLKDSKLVLPKIKEFVESVFHLYVLQSENRKELVEYLNKNGIAVGVFYPVPLHLQKAHENLGYKKGDMPVAEYLSQRTFSIPVFPDIKSEEQDYIVEKIFEFEKLKK